MDESEKEVISAPSGGLPAGSRWYEIRLQGHLHPRWSACYDGLTITNETGGITALRGPVIDQAALHGVLHRVRDTGLALISVTQLDREEQRILTDAPTDP